MRVEGLLLTGDETLCVLAACCTVLGSHDERDLVEPEGIQSARTLRDATAKIAQAVGMTLEQLSAFAATAAGSPSEALVTALEEE